MQHHNVLIVGGGQAGAQTAISLRQAGFKGSIVIIDAEPFAPYDRPPLSKTYLAGEISSEQLALRPASFWHDNAIELLQSDRVLAIDPVARTATCLSGAIKKYDNLVWAAGGHARRLSCPGSDLKGIHVVRTQNDVNYLRSDLEHAERVTIVGGGYIGLETAAVLAKQGKKVTLLEAQDRVLARVTCPVVSTFYERVHREHGVHIQTNVSVVSLSGKDQRVERVHLSDGRELISDVVVVGIGLIPQTNELAQAQAECNNGIMVDDQCRTSLPNIFAIGDCANHVNRYAGYQRIRLESIQNANDQAKVVAANLVGKPTTYDALPWFWSNQYHLRLQGVGLNMGYDEHIVRGNPANGEFSVIYLREGKVIALDCINKPRDFIQGKQLVMKNLALAPELLANTTQDLTQLAATMAL